MRIIMTIAIILDIVLAAAATQPCTPAKSPQLDAEITRFENQLKTTPDDPVLLYNLAADYGEKCDSARTLVLLHKIADGDSGLDPAQYRDFVFMRDTAEFQAITAQIRRKNPARIQSKPAFVIKEPGLIPEGMAYARFNGRLYAGSMAKRKIVWTDKTGELHDLVKPGADGLGRVLGLHVDEARKQLWAVSSVFGIVPTPAEMVPGLFKYDLTTGKFASIYRASDKDAGFNDVTLVPSSGEAYTTDPPQGTVYVARNGSRELERLLPAGTVPGANGIALSDDEKTLFVAGDFGITRVDLRTKSAILLPTPAGVIDASMDGLYFYRQSLVGIQNAIHPGRVMRFYLDPVLARVTRAEILETYNPLFEQPTTGSLDGDSLLFMANTQLFRWSPDKPMPPMNELHDIQVLRIALKE